MFGTTYESLNSIFRKKILTMHRLIFGQCFISFVFLFLNNKFILFFRKEKFFPHIINCHTIIHISTSYAFKRKVLFFCWLFHMCLKCNNDKKQQKVFVLYGQTQVEDNNIGYKCCRTIIVRSQHNKRCKLSRTGKCRKNVEFVLYGAYVRALAMSGNFLKPFQVLETIKPSCVTNGRNSILWGFYGLRNIYE